MRREKCPLELAISALLYSKTRLAAFGVGAKSGAGISTAGQGRGLFPIGSWALTSSVIKEVELSRFAAIGKDAIGRLANRRRT
jgi:hypothetical protein